jgi:hypothetical protein
VRAEIVVDFLHELCGKKLTLDVGDYHTIPVVPVRGVVDLGDHPNCDNDNERAGNIE